MMVESLISHQVRVPGDTDVSVPQPPSLERPEGTSSLVTAIGESETNSPDRNLESTCNVLENKQAQREYSTLWDELLPHGNQKRTQVFTTKDEAL